MSKSNKKSRRRKPMSFPWMPVMLGFALIGITLAMVATPKSGNQGGDLSSVVPMEVSFTAPELSLQNLEGKTESLANYRKNVVLVNNWATWCPPCKAEMPTLSAYYNEHEAEGFMIIAIEAGDKDEGVSQFAERYGLKFTVWLDPNGASLQAFGNRTLPNSYVIDRAGTVRLAWTGEINKVMLEKYVTPLLSEN